MKAAAYLAWCISVVPVVYAAELPGEDPAAISGAVSESDFLADVPTVISVSRIAQSLADTPGAVTVLDRQFIRMSGARDVVSLLAYVPGFQTTTCLRLPRMENPAKKASVPEETGPDGENAPLPRNSTCAKRSQCLDRLLIKRISQNTPESKDAGRS